MMVSIGVYMRRWQRLFRRRLLDSRLHGIMQILAYVLCGGILSAASLGGYPQPLALALVCAASGWPGVLLAAGGLGGYLLFWGQAGSQGVLWILGGGAASLLLSQRTLTKQTPLLMPVLTGAIVAVSGLAFQLWQGDTTPVLMYLLRIFLAFAANWVFSTALQRKDPVITWLVYGLGTLALAQIRPIPYLGLGYIAAGLLATSGAFPAAALSGLALDLAGITPVPMTAVLCLAWLTRLIPGKIRYLRYAAVPAVYLLVMGLCGFWDLQPVPGLILGALGAMLLPGKPGLAHRRGETGFAQVRLEMVSSALNQTELLLGDANLPPIDEQALLSRAVEQACSDCPNKKHCKEKPENLSTALLHKPLSDTGALGLSCRKSGRLLQQLRRSQEQLRTIRADRERQQEYRLAVMQQYRFLSDYLQELSDSLARRQSPPSQWFEPEIGISSASREGVNGDKCCRFAGVSCRYYILLCDGMGTGPEAAKDAMTASTLLKKLLTAGYPAQYALESINSLCALSQKAGAVTIDLLELELDTGKATLYKWGAPTSYLLSGTETIKLGTASPPPGLSVSNSRETVEKLSLRRGQTLIMLSDGAGGEDAVRLASLASGEPAGELADRILQSGPEDRSDDATVAVVRLRPVNPGVS